MGVFGYADDLSLLCPSFSGIKEMLNICERFASDNKILFNASKSQLLYFSKKDDPMHSCSLQLTIFNQLIHFCCCWSVHSYLIT